MRVQYRAEPDGMDCQAEGEASGKNLDTGPLVGGRRGLLGEGTRWWSVQVVHEEGKVTNRHASMLKEVYVCGQQIPRLT
jgi:hypothetical protein